MGIKPFKVSSHNLRIHILFKDCLLGSSERRQSRNEHSYSKSISEQIHRPAYVLLKPESPEIKPLCGYQSTDSRKAQCIKDSVLLDETCGSVGVLKGVSYMILPENLMNLIRQGEGLTVEFKK